MKRRRYLIDDSIRAISVIEKIPNLNEGHISLIIQCAVENDQIYNSNGACNHIEGFLAKNKDKINSTHSKIFADRLPNLKY